MRDKDGMAMVYVPPPNEASVPYIDVPEGGYWIDKYEVSNAQYVRCVNERLCSSSYFAGNDSYNKPEYPVVGVTWFDAAAYSAWVRGELPTDEMWEYAAFGETGNIYPWGNELDCSFATYKDCREGPSPVRQNTGGASWVLALNLVGNVGEWTNSSYDRDYPNKDTCTKGASSIRGGSWLEDTDAFNAPNADCRDRLSDFTGFRTVHLPPSQ